MQTIYIPHYDQLHHTVAQYILSKITASIAKRQPFTLGLATGATPLGIYKTLIPLLGNSGLDLSQLHTVNLDEYIGLTRDHPNSYYAEMMRNFWQPLQQLSPTFQLKNAHIPDTAATDTAVECEQYERQIQAAGGIDLQILGIGTNGHIAFNEPGSKGESRTRMVSIDEETRHVNAGKFFANDISKVPTHAITMGIGTILEAREIILIALGESKKPIMTKLLSLQNTTESIPASFLLKHENTTIYTDITI